MTKDLRIKISKFGVTIAIVCKDQSKCINGKNTGGHVKSLQALVKTRKHTLKSITSIQKDGILGKLIATISMSLVIEIQITNGLIMELQSLQED